MGNPGRVYYRAGDLILDGTIVINGTLVVSGNLRLERGAIVTIEPVKNFPALIVGSAIHFDDRTASLSVTGLVQVNSYIDMHSRSGGILEVYGGLYISGGGIMNTGSSMVTVTSVPNSAAIKTWSGPGSSVKWSPVGGAFYKNIKRW